MRRLIWILLGLVIILSCVVVGLGGYWVFNHGFSSFRGNAPVAGGGLPPTENVTETASPTAAVPTVIIPTVGATSTPEVTNPTLDELLNTNIPRNDPLQITARLKKKTGVFATPAAPKT